MICPEELETLINCACDDCMRDYFVLVTTWKPVPEFLRLGEALDRIDINMRVQVAKEALRKSKWEYYYFI